MTLKTFKTKQIFFFNKLNDILSCKKRKKYQNSPFKKKSVLFSFLVIIFFFKQLIRYVNVLKINSFCCLLTDTFVNFRKPPFVKRTLPSPTGELVQAMMLT